MSEVNRCPISENCGGCLYQGVSYEDQLRTKDKQIRNLLHKHKIPEDCYQGLVPAISEVRYRNKMEYSFGDLEKGGPLELGMHLKGRFMSIITSDCCELVPEDFNRVLRAVLDFCREKGYPFYHRKTHEGLLRNLVVRCGVRTRELLVDIVTTSNGEFDEEGFLGCLQALELDHELVGVMRTYNDSVADAVINEGTKILYGRDYYNEEILGLRFKVNLFAFFQTNIAAIERLYSDALALIPDIEGKTVYDLYCGTGTISQLMALKAREVYGVEIIQDSVDAAIDNAELNGISNCHFICGDVRKTLDQLPVLPEMIVVDPPRVGMHDKVVDMLAGYGIPEILYISCNPKTLCMNLERFAQYGYEPVLMRAYDNFPKTKHVETVVLMSKENT
ncbi:MAG: 23S rRNA (uracil(1939)-C(5))-methyltransferase RlmD [Mogibacterium sp.]|nr:23S rRNA (uracil(1939)-C(5))-methyltransferase RlmD [Mogibacterium sp.]